MLFYVWLFVGYSLDSPHTRLWSLFISVFTATHLLIREGGETIRFRTSGNHPIRVVQDDLNLSTNHRESFVLCPRDDRSKPILASVRDVSRADMQNGVRSWVSDLRVLKYVANRKKKKTTFVEFSLSTLTGTTACATDVRPALGNRTRWFINRNLLYQYNSVKDKVEGRVRWIRVCERRYSAAFRGVGGGERGRGTGRERAFIYGIIILRTRHPGGCVINFRTPRESE